MIKKLSSFFGGHSRITKLLVVLLGVVFTASIVYAIFRVFIVLLGTLLYFWSFYLKQTWLLWVATFLSLGIIFLFIYLLVIKRNEYLRKENDKTVEEQFQEDYDFFDDDWR